MEEGSWIEVIREMQKIQLLSHEADHVGERCPYRIGFGNTSFSVQLVWQAASDTMGLAVNL